MAGAPGYRAVMAVLLATLGFGCGQPDRSIDLTLAAHRIQAEIAATPDRRELGLMHLRGLPEDAGMLFVFPSYSRQCMWMKNTLIPLSVAFLDDQGKLLNVAEMAAQDLRLHCSTGPARYALEMNAGWFGRHGVKAGITVAGLAKAPAPE